MSTMSITEANTAVKEIVVPVLFEHGLNSMEVNQIDTYKWVVPVEVEGVQRYATIALSANKADYSEEDLMAAIQKYNEKVERKLAKEARAKEGKAKAKAKKAEAETAEAPFDL